MKRTFIGVAILVAATTAQAQFLNLDPGTGANLFTTNSNDGYSVGRGMVFTMNSTVSIDSVGLYTEIQGGNATFDLYKVITTTGQVNVGATLIASSSGPLNGGLGYLDMAMSATLQAGGSYHLEVTYAEAAIQNWFYNWNGPDVNLGVMTIHDGTQSHDTGNTVAPVMRVHMTAVPEPATLAVLGLGLGLVALARRKRK